MTLLHGYGGSWHRRDVIIIFTSIAFLAVAFLASDTEGTTIHVPGDQPTIQDAVNASRAGDTILIAAGIYNESVDVTKRLTIEGEGAGVTILHFEEAYVLKLTRSDTRVGNLTIDGTRDDHGIWLEDVRFCWIGNVSFTDNVRGVYMDNAKGCLFSDCSFIDSDKGVWIQPGSDGNSFRSCQFINGSTGWYINTRRVTSGNNTLMDCEFRGNTHRAVTIEGSGLNTLFFNCTIEGNAFGVDLDSCRNTTFIDCSISFNLGEGLYVDDAEGLIVRDCTIRSNRHSCISRRKASSARNRGSTWRLSFSCRFFGRSTSNPRSFGSTSEVSVATIP